MKSIARRCKWAIALAMVTGTATVEPSTLSAQMVCCDETDCDGSLPDAGLCDAGLPDAGLCDAGLCDANFCDANACDANACDANACEAAACPCGGGSCGLCQQYAALSKSLAEGGISFQNNLTQFYMGTTSGGLQRDFRYGGHGDYLMNVDFGKLGVQEGLFLKVRAEHRFGRSLAGTTGALLPSNLAADLPVVGEEDLAITNFLVTQALSESFVVFAGKLDTLDGDSNAFASGRGITQFSNLAFVANPLTLRTVPYSTLGAGFAVLDNGLPVFAFNVLNAVDTADTIGIDELFDEGVVLASEVILRTKLGGLDGQQLFGATWSSRDFVSLGQDPRIVLPTIPINEVSGSWSAYWNTHQYLVQDARDPTKGWGYFARAGVADNDANPFSFFLSAGIGGTSQIRGRQNDSFGIGYYYSGTSDEIGPLATFLAGPIGDGQGFEAFYNVALGRSLTITPDIQVIDPARENVDTAVVVGLRANIAF